MAPKLKFEIDEVVGFNDPREVPAYTIPESAQYLGIPKSTVRAWVLGTTYGQAKKSFDRVISLPVDGLAQLSYFNLAEAFVLRALRDQRIRLDYIRQALEHVKKEVGWERPLIQEQFRTDGVSLFIERLGGLLDAVTMQQLLPDVFESHLKRIDWENDLAAILYPFTRSVDGRSQTRSVAIDPRRSFGRPIVDRIGVATAMIHGRWRAGDTIATLAEDYACGAEEIEEALCYESGGRAA